MEQNGAQIALWQIGKLRQAQDAEATQERLSPICLVLWRPGELGGLPKSGPKGASCVHRSGNAGEAHDQRPRERLECPSPPLGVRSVDHPEGTGSLIRVLRPRCDLDCEPRRLQLRPPQVLSALQPFERAFGCHLSHDPDA